MKRLSVFAALLCLPAAAVLADPGSRPISSKAHLAGESIAWGTNNPVATGTHQISMIGSASLGEGDTLDGIGYIIWDKNDDVADSGNAEPIEPDGVLGGFQQISRTLASGTYTAQVSMGYTDAGGMYHVVETTIRGVTIP